MTRPPNASQPRRSPARAAIRDGDPAVAPDAGVERCMADVWTTLGQCYRAMQRLDDAVRAYTRALELDPGSTLALVGGAEAQFALEHADLAALADFDRGLTTEREPPLALAGRAIVHYQCGRCAKASAELDLAVARAPRLAELYQNRAAAL
jgi:tetratricopeptide (TPR) repeat protein